MIGKCRTSTARGTDDGATPVDVGRVGCRVGANGRSGVKKSCSYDPAYCLHDRQNPGFVV